MQRRLFLALPTTIDRYQQLRDSFDGCMEGRWVPSQNLHLTLCFLGDRFDTNEVSQKMSGFPTLQEPIEITGLGLMNHSRILYARVANHRLEAYVKELCTRFGIEPIHPFAAHVTLMRIKEIVNPKALGELLDSYRSQYLGQVNTCIELFSSELHPGGARYTSIQRFC